MNRTMKSTLHDDRTLLKDKTKNKLEAVEVDKELTKLTTIYPAKITMTKF